MTRNPRSEKIWKNFRRIRGGDRNRGEESPGASGIGSRVFPFRSLEPASASMPSVGTRRSTRVFLPRQQRLSTGDGRSGRTLRSGKRFDLAMGKDVDRRDWLKAVKDEPKERIKEKSFGAVYSRKRRRSTENRVKDRMFGIVYQRRHCRRVTSEVPTVELEVREFRVLECSKNFGEKLGFVAEGELWRGVECGSVVLAVLVDSAVCSSSDRFGRVLVSVMTWMRRARVELSVFVTFLLGGSIGGVFALNGIHFLPMRSQKNRILNGNSVSGCGLCLINGARELVPLLFVDYSALPSYFKYLHSGIILGSQYLPSILRSKTSVPVLENQLVVVPCGKHVYADDPLEKGLLGVEFPVSETHAVKRNEMLTVEDSCVPVSLNSVIINGSGLRKHQRKRSSQKNLRARNPFLINTRRRASCTNENRSVSTSAKNDFAIPPVSVKPPDSCFSNLFSGTDESDISSTPVSYSKLRNAAGKKSPIEKIKELRLALAEVRQNIDSVCCNANLLVTDTEKCWREDGAQVRLELSDSQEWFIAVKRGDVTRFLHKPQDLRPCIINRFTHAYMWSGDDDWKLEFADKWDWHVFKELHMECQNRNTQDASVNIIPVPGVREVSGYEDFAEPSFVRPDTYINIMNDEVGRALASETSYYDMDLADEEWLRNLNASSLDAQDGGTNYVSDENFERIIFTLEKDAYSSLDDASDKERALDLCHHLGTRDMVSAIYDYWLQKRELKRTPLVRVFQGPPVRKTQSMKKPLLRKKRSLKRQRSQAERNQVQWSQGGRGKPDLFCQDHRGLVRRVEEAEAAASRAVEVATKLRTIAQMLTSNADLAAYKAAMAHRIAETIRLSSSSATEPPDFDSSILFD